MIHTTLAENMKKFRIDKNMTQEQTADALNINPQTVSRWECGTTLPDALTLFELAKLYGVTIDDFYRKHSVVYENYAQRLSAVYEKTHDPEDFLRCILEYKKLMKNSELSLADKWNIATVYHFMMNDCKTEALKWYDDTLADDPQKDLNIYNRARSLRLNLLFDIGKGKDAIEEQKAKRNADPENPTEWTTLIEAYIYAKEYELAYSTFLTASAKFPNDWRLLIYGGEICKKLQKYNEALNYLDKAGEIGTYFYDELFEKASCYHDMGAYETAYTIYCDIAEKLHAEHYDEEAEIAENYTKEIKLNIL